MATSKMAESVSLILPVYNEQALLEETVTRFLEGLAKFTDSYEIVVVDDAGSDKTGEIADSLSARHPQVRVLHNIVNLGAGTSLLRGMKAATGDIVLHDSADVPFDLDDLATGLPLLAEADIAVAVRVDRAAHSPWRKVTSVGNKALIHLLFRPKIADMNFIQIYRRRVIDDLDVINVLARSPAFVTPELLIRARDKGYRVVPFQAVFHRRKAGRASYGKPHDILWTFYDMLRFRIRLGEIRKARRGGG